MVVTEEKLCAAFGVEMPANEPEEPAAQQESENSQQRQEDPQTDPEPGAVGADPQMEDEAGDPQGGEGDQPLTAEQRRENAARRRKQEQQAAVNSAVQTALQAEKQRTDAQMKEFFASAGLKNTFTGMPITNMEEFQSWNSQRKNERLQRELQAGKLTQEGLAQAISEHPAVQAAQELVQRAEADAKARQKEQDKAVIDAELVRINARDPSIKTVEDLLKMPNAEQFRDLVRRGYSFEDAHYLVNRERFEQAAAEAARQKALNDTRSKAHLTGTGTARGTGTAAVPQAEMDLYRKFNPKATEEEIRAHYNKYLKK